MKPFTTRILLCLSLFSVCLSSSAAGRFDKLNERILALPHPYDYIVIFAISILILFCIILVKYYDSVKEYRKKFLVKLLIFLILLVTCLF